MWTPLEKSASDFRMQAYIAYLPDSIFSEVNYLYWAFSEVQHRVRLGSTHASLVAFGYHAREARSDLTHECFGEERYTHD